MRGILSGRGTKMPLKEEPLSGLSYSASVRHVQIRPGPDNETPFTFNSIEGGKQGSWLCGVPSLDSLAVLLDINRMWAKKRGIPLAVEILVPGLEPAALMLADSEVKH